MWETFAGTLVNVGEALVNVALWVRQSSPEFAKLRRSSDEGAHVLLVRPGTCLTFVGPEDVNGEKLTVKKWWIFNADFFMVWCRFFTVYADFSRFVRDINGENRTSRY